MKNIETLEAEAKTAREEAIFAFESESVSMKDKVDSVILASVAMITYQAALAEKTTNTCKEL